MNAKNAAEYLAGLVAKAYGDGFKAGMAFEREYDKPATFQADAPLTNNAGARAELNTQVTPSHHNRDERWMPK